MAKIPLKTAEKKELQKQKQIAKEEKKKEEEWKDELRDVMKIVAGRRALIPTPELRGDYVNFFRAKIEKKEAFNYIEDNVRPTVEEIPEAEKELIEDLSKKLKKYVNAEEVYPITHKEFTQKTKEKMINWAKETRKAFPKSEGNLVFSRYICSCCGKIFTVGGEFIDNAYPSHYSFFNSSRINEKGEPLRHFCAECGESFLKYLIEFYEGDEVKALERWCCEANVYWDYDIYLGVKKMSSSTNTGEATGICGQYSRMVKHLGFITQGFWDSPSVKVLFNSPMHNLVKNKLNKDSFDKIIEQVAAGNFAVAENSYTKEEVLQMAMEAEEAANPYNIPSDWNREEAMAKRRIIKILRYDPFENELEDDQKLLYKSLDTILDEEMEEDFIKQQAALEIVRSFQKIERIRKEENKIERSDMTSSRLKELSDLRKKEFEVLSKISADQGFSAKFGAKKAKGAGTLTGVMNEMNQKHYQPSLVNYYDVLTTKEMQEVANMSIQAIFNQLNLGENELYDVTKTQTERLVLLQKELDKTKEALREANIKIEEQKLKEKARKEGKDIDDFEDRKG